MSFNFIFLVKMFKKLSFSLIIVLLLTSCVELAVTSIVGGVAVFNREKAPMSTKNDVIIAAKINKQIARKELFGNNNFIEVLVDEGRVLVVAKVKNNQQRKQIIDIVWSVKGVKEFVNEIKILSHTQKVEKPYKKLAKKSKDAAISSQIRSRLLAKRQASLVNVQLQVMDGNAYVIGVSSNQHQMNAIHKAIATTKGVKKVVSYIILADDSRRT